MNTGKVQRTWRFVFFNTIGATVATIQLTGVEQKYRVLAGENPSGVYIIRKVQEGGKIENL
ncbi:MAG: hypothetical protein N2517_06920 [Ignavibacteria bacterium]|nr:hypothetical protein [Ignavibacteria bacterium]